MFIIFVIRKTSSFIINLKKTNIMKEDEIILTNLTDEDIDLILT